MRAHEENRSSADRTPAPVRSATPVPPLLTLQRAAGNAAVTRAIEEARHEHGPDCGHTASAVQREAVQRDAVPNEADGPAVQRRSSVYDAISSPGSPLAGHIRSKAEQAYGMSFAHVRVHSGPVAQRSALEYGARAYTTGSDIVVGEQGVDDETLFHEIDHVHQQSTGPVAGADDGSGARVSDPGDPFERRAGDNGRRMAQGQAPDLGDIA
ncbi:DUF4157 domain-containing protein [Streptomyces sp. SID13726]|uniref:eCIS core domain-containing protein n=1 Tax=Streptomyces sp. SID13726 TaxID=2706058 RepID=UPI0013B5D5F9|nr:DUF4157 domain-containing protein [Streptomyces sp. SID13726]NEB05159.1 DUF4157 domain-containing protein [Streptomyces sp. SID13726]